MFGILAETFGFQSKSDSNQLSCNEFFREVRDKISQYSALFVVLPFDAKCQLKHQVLAKFTQIFTDMTITCCDIFQLCTCL